MDSIGGVADDGMNLRTLLDVVRVLGSERPSGWRNLVRNSCWVDVSEVASVGAR